ncbi:MAG: trypsin-like peptidase domain-containing protein [Planctomycetia bacterium]|nr:trypsin-like peptidase domain-containing protein [Planctomycetia bacterium]
MPRKRHLPGPTVNGWLVMILLALVIVLVYRDVRRHNQLLDPEAAERLVTARGDLADDELSTIDLFKNISPSVVHVTNLAQKVDENSFNVMEIPRGVGSGFIWGDDGYIVTNYHVIQGAAAAKITLADNTILDAKLVGFDDSKDIAVLKVNAPPEKLRPILLGSSSDLQVGQKVFAIGSPFELDQTLTTGVIGGLGREIQSVSGRPIQGVIQTDAAINPGNSGGPLLDSSGRLIGVNTAIASPSGGSVGIGFAVPVDIVRRVVPQLIRTGKVERPGLGIRTVDDRITRRMGLEGVLVDKVMPNSAAGKAGLRSMDREKNAVGDLITAINGHEIRNHDDLYLALDTRTIGDTVKVAVLRDGKTIELSVTLQPLPTVSP